MISPTASGSDMRDKRSLTGFTLIELLAVLVIISLLLAISSPRYFQSIDKSKETILKQNLASLRNVIDQYHGDTGNYPESLEVLVEKKYIREIPIDPVTGRADTWLLVRGKELSIGEGVVDVFSGAQGVNSHGVPFGDL